MSCRGAGAAAPGISQHEIVTEGYIEKKDPSLTVRFPLIEQGPGRVPPGVDHHAVDPHLQRGRRGRPELTYLKVRQGEEILYLSKGCTRMLKGPYTVVGELKGKDMVGWRYAGPFDDLPASSHQGGWAEPGMRRLFQHISQNAAQAHRVVAWDEVGRDGRHRHRPHRAGLRGGGLPPGQGRRPPDHRAAG